MQGDLARTQFLSLATKAATLVLGLAQSVIVIRLLSKGEFGITGLVMSIGGLIGVTQNLGIVDGAIREIAVLKNKDEMGAVFWVSHLVRQMVTVPLSVGLMALAGIIAARIYHRPEITPYIEMFAAVLILQGLQDVLGATLTGLKKFVQLYAIQIITAAANVAIFGLLVWKFRVTGFFLAIILTTTLMVVLLLAAIWQELKGHLRWPDVATLKIFARRVMRIGAYMYLSRIGFVVWQRLPILLLGGVVAVDELGYLNASLTFGSKLTIIAAALSEVNLSWMSSLFSTSPEEFRRVAQRNMQRVLLLLAALTLVLIFFTPELLQYVVGEQYLPAQRIIILMTLAFFLYSLIDVGTSSVLVSANRPRLRAVIYGVMTAITAAVIGWSAWQKPDISLAAEAVLLGAAVAYALTVYITRRRFQVDLLTGELKLFILALFVSGAWLLTEPQLAWRLLVFLVLAAYIAAEAYRSKLVPENLFGLKRQAPTDIGITCFAGAPLNFSSWTNRQHIMSRLSKKARVLYVEPRIWIGRFIWLHWREPKVMGRFIKKTLWFERRHDNLYVKAQWNLVPGSRVLRGVSLLNHLLNRWSVLIVGWWLGFSRENSVMWVYDTEAAEFLSAFKRGIVVYDCVDDHAVQAGPNRNPKKVSREEEAILKRADLVTVTSKRLFEQKSRLSCRVKLVLNAGDVQLFQERQENVPEIFKQLKRPVIGSVGALDSYKIDFDLVYELVEKRPDWQFVFIGAPVVERSLSAINRLKEFKNVHLTGPLPRQQVPAYVHQFNACIIPYRANQYNAASFPLKFWEFMATGKPIVVSGLPELKGYVPLIGYAENADAFIGELEEWLKDNQRGAEEKKQLARGHGWQQRADELLRLLNEVLNERKL